MATYFPNTSEGNVNKKRFANIKFKHHNRNQNQDWGQSSLCLPYQVAGFCPFGIYCKDNHRFRAGLLRSHKDDDKVMKDLKKTDDIFVAIYR